MAHQDLETITQCVNDEVDLALLRTSSTTERRLAIMELYNIAWIVLDGYRRGLVPLNRLYDVQHNFRVDENIYCPFLNLKAWIMALNDKRSFERFMMIMTIITREILQTRARILRHSNRNISVMARGYQRLRAQGLEALSKGEKFSESCFRSQGSSIQWTFEWTPRQIIEWKDWLRFWDDADGFDWLGAIKKVEQHLPPSFWTIGPPPAWRRFRRPIW